MIFTLVTTLLTASAANLELPAPSPRATVSQQVGTVNVALDYSSPGKKGRAIFGDLVPYGKLWRTGANGATTVTLSGDASIGGVDVPAGEYALFTEPGEAEWTVILNSNPNQGGTGSYDKSLDVGRFTVKPVTVDARERLTFLFVDTTDSSATLHLEWAGVALPIAIEVDSADRAKSSIDGFVKGSARQLANAARFHNEAGTNDEALKLVDASLAVQETWFATWIKANIQSGLGDKKNAYKTLKKAMELGERDGGFFYKDRVEAALKDWPKK